MTFKDLYLNIKKHLQECIDGKPLVFTHRAFFGYKFKIEPIKQDKKD